MNTEYIVARQRLAFSHPPKGLPDRMVVSLVTPPLFEDLVARGYEIMSIDIEGKEAFAVCRRTPMTKIGPKV